MGRGVDIETSRTGRRIEDRELNPTSAGHPRCGVEDEPEEVEGEETLIEGKSRVQIRLKFASERRGRHRGASKKFDNLSGRESCREVGRIIRESMEVFGRKSTATRDGEGGALVQLIIQVEEFAILINEIEKKEGGGVLKIFLIYKQ